MITYANSYDKNAVYQLWKQLFSHDDGGYTDYYFQYRYHEAITYVYKVDGKVVATLQRRKHQLVFDEQVISASMILGVATNPTYQGKGYMRALMKRAIEDAQQTESITMIQAYQPEMYRKFGFKPYYYGNEVVYQMSNLPIKGVLGEVDYQQCMGLYVNMMKQCNGYMVRDEQYYKNYQVELAAQGYTMVGYYEAGLMQAYAVLERDDGFVVSECVGSSNACKAILALIYQKYGVFHLRHIDNKKTEIIDTMFLFHDWEMTKQLLQTDASSPDEYFISIKKPLFFHECA